MQGIAEIIRADVDGWLTRKPPTFLPGHECSLEWKVERGHCDPLTCRPYPDEECDRREREAADRSREEREWTPHYFRRLFGIRTTHSRQGAKGADKDEVRGRVDVAAMLDRYGVPHRIVGDTITFICQSHNDTRPSASFSKSKRVFFCHVCGDKGDVFSWIMNVENCPFPQAVDILSRL